MDARDRKRKRERRERREAAQRRAELKRADRPRLAPIKAVRRMPEPMMPYKVNLPVARKWGIDTGLKNALDEFGSAARNRLRLSVLEPLVSLVPNAVGELPDTPATHKLPEAGRPLDRTRQAREFAVSPEDTKSAPPRENNCKSRPTNNRSTGGGGGKKRFVPWC